jgi:hypothetical protein
MSHNLIGYRNCASATVPSSPKVMKSQEIVARFVTGTVRAA